MSTAIVIATREIRERSRLFIVAGALAILPFAVALAPGARGNRTHAIMVIGAAAAFNYACAVALAMGVSTIGRDLTEKRLSFYFSKPISPLALWTGKAGASLLIALASSLIIAVPSVLAAREAWKTAWITGGDRLALALPVLLALLFFGSHAIGTMTRSRSVLVALDFVFAVVMIGVVVAILRPILFAGGGSVALAFGYALGGGFLLILAVAPIWQLAHGRTDARRSHAAFSKFFWSAIAILLVLASATLVWLRSVTPSDLIEVRDVEQAPAGGWAFVTGLGAHRGDFHSTFLMNAATGEYSRLPTPPWSGVAWSRDGRVVAWMEPIGIRFQGVCELYVRSAGSKESRATGIRAHVFRQFALSDDGTRVAVANDGIVAVHDLVNHRVLASVRGMEDYRSRLFFITNDVLRIIDYRDMKRPNVGTMRISDLDARTRKLTTYGQRENAMPTYPVSVSEDGSRMFIRMMGEIVDGRTLAPVAKIAPAANWGSAMLNDGSVIVIDRTNGVRLRVFDRDGHPRGVLELPSARYAYVSGETTDGKLLLSVGTLPVPARGGHAVIVVDRGRLVIERVVQDVSGPMAQGPRTARYAAGMSFVSEDGNGKLKIWR